MPWERKVPQAPWYFPGPCQSRRRNDTVLFCNVLLYMTGSSYHLIHGNHLYASCKYSRLSREFVAVLKAPSKAGPPDSHQWNRDYPLPEYFSHLNQFYELLPASLNTAYQSKVSFLMNNLSSIISVLYLLKQILTFRFYTFMDLFRPSSANMWYK